MKYWINWRHLEINFINLNNLIYFKQFAVNGKVGGSSPLEGETFIKILIFSIPDETTQQKSEFDDDYEDDEEEEEEEEESHREIRRSKKTKPVKKVVDYSKHNVSKKYLRIHSDKMSKWKEHTLNMLITKQVCS